MHVVLAHGASGSAASMKPWVEGLAERGVSATAIDIPVRRAESALEPFRSAALTAGTPTDGLVIGGQSYGGRVASLLAAEEDPETSSSTWRGLVLMCYPLHRPGAPESGLRVEHWPRLRLPMLMLSGESDPFARIDLLRASVREGLPSAELVTFPGVGHTLASVRDEALDRIAAFVSGLATS